MRKFILAILFAGAVLSGTSMKGQSIPELLSRGLADTVGFAHLDWQMDSVMARIRVLNHDDLIRSQQAEGTVWRTAICPHDDYAYAGWLYPAVLSNMKAGTVIIFGVAHQASSFNLEDQLVFDSFKSWHGPYGAVKVSSIRDEIISQLPGDMAVVNDSLETVEHSVEALIPFLQYQDRAVEVISILVPYMDFERMQAISQHLAGALFTIMQQKKLRWGEDIALLITSDAVHYGDESWDGKNYAPYGTDRAGNAQAVSYEREIISTCFEGELTGDKIARTAIATPRHWVGYPAIGFK